MTNNGDKGKGEISRPIRLTVIAFGVISWVAGGIGTFKYNNAVGFTTLIVAGSFALLVAGIGRWPNKLGLGGGDAEWIKAVAAHALAFENYNAEPTSGNHLLLQKAHKDMMSTLYKSIN